MVKILLLIYLKLFTYQHIGDGDNFIFYKSIRVFQRGTGKF